MNDNMTWIAKWNKILGNSRPSMLDVLNVVECKLAFNKWILALGTLVIVML